MGHQNGWGIREAGEWSERRLPKVGEGGMDIGMNWTGVDTV
jgi:hypothetical protein